MQDEVGGERSRDGRYRVCEPIAPGPSATVFLGQVQSAEGFTAIVAIERLRPGLSADPQQAARVCGDVGQAVRVSHANVVATRDAFEVGGIAYVVSEHVPGESLARLLVQAEAQSRPASPALSAAITIGLLHGLHAVHEATAADGEPLGWIHGAISPRAVLVGTDGLARVLGLALAQERARSRTLGGAQLPAGVAYLAPEQLLGEPVDRRTDVYAVAAVLWELLVGRGLFATHRQRPAGDDPVRQILEADVEPPSAVHGEVPRKLDAVVMRGLNRASDARYATAREFAIALEEAVSPATARQVGDWVAEVAASPLRCRAERRRAREQAGTRAAPTAVAAEPAPAKAADPVMDRPGDQGFSTLVSPQPQPVSPHPGGGSKSSPPAAAEVATADAPSDPAAASASERPTAAAPAVEPADDRRPNTLPSGALGGPASNPWTPRGEPIPSVVPASLGRDTIELPVSSRKWLLAVVVAVVVALAVIWAVI